MLEAVTLAGRHVRLEPLSPEHVPALSEVGIDPELWRWTLANIRTPEDMRAYVDAALRERDAGHALPFATVDAASGRVVGSTRFTGVSLADGRVEIGWTWLARPWQRTPANTEAKYLMLRHAFEALGCVRVELKTDALNERSRAAILRVGATQEGILRKHMRSQEGRMRDTVYFSILDDEWPAVRAGLEARLARPWSAR
ncbi:MAG TPA: GNAT family protein [Longimicrobiaceae bacterium]|nr:GNAT family protein [Longimicrobiaceae bacterium]